MDVRNHSPSSNYIPIDCPFPGWPCDAHDPCAVKPICGPDYKCGPQSVTDCSDGLDCTTNSCDGMGGCLPPMLKSGWCLIDKICFRSGAQNPVNCGTCDPTQDRHNWTIPSGICRIDGGCQNRGDLNSGKCAVCDPARSTTAWTVNKGSCLIGTNCYASWVKHPSGCGVCNPQKSQTAWTMLKNACLIADKCYPSGAREAGGCGTCDPNKSTSSWTRPPGCLAAYAWSKSFGGTSHDYGRTVTVDTRGNVYIAGEFISRGINFGGTTHTNKECYDLFIASYTPSGVFRWSKTFGSTGADPSEYFNCFVATSDITVDANGNITIVGNFCNKLNFGGKTLSSSEYSNAYVASFDSTGKHRWSRDFATNNSYDHGVAADSRGNVYVTGDFRKSMNAGGGLLTSAGGSDIFLASFDSTGKHRWSKTFGTHMSDTGRDVAVDVGGNIYMTGYFEFAINFGGSLIMSRGYEDIFLASFDSTGNHRWSKGFGDLSFDHGLGVAVDNKSNVYFTGYIEGDTGYSKGHTGVDFGGGKIKSKGNYEIFLASFTSAGKHRWSRGFGTIEDETGRSVTTDSRGNVYITGDSDLPLSLGGSLLGGKSYDIVVASYTSEGIHRWSRRHGSTASDAGESICTSPGGDVYISGWFEGRELFPSATPPIEFGGKAHKSAGSYDIFLLKLAQ